MVWTLIAILCFGQIPTNAEDPAQAQLLPIPDDPLEFVTIEHFEDRAALDPHQAHAHTLEALEELRGVIDGEVQPEIFSDE